jgi:hypothetical protein
MGPKRTADHARVENLQLADKARRGLPSQLSESRYDFNSSYERRSDTGAPYDSSHCSNSDSNFNSGLEKKGKKRNAIAQFAIHALIFVFSLLLEGLLHVVE